MNKPNEKLQALFEAAVALETEEQRADYLNRACPEPELRREVESLLAAHQNPDSLFEEKTVRVETPPSEGIGTLIGRYKLLEALGEGGFGTVWLAEQKEPVRRKVALKVIKLGMDTKQVVARFEAERQALALMDHPNIAKVLDAGTTDTGRPYFVMELVRGIPITKFCDENKLTTRERLDLFIKVCHAVQHAHQKGIIHRDLKPSNVLVTLHDGVPVPKVIDFGIAKATQQELTDKTIHTLFQQFIGTPAYVSPEQAEMSGLDIDTRTDIYSLGVLLYELLTGFTPFNAQTLMQSGLDEMRRIIREEEPKRPSTRLSTLEMAEATTLTKHRQEKLPALVNLVRGDLDWIVMKCLEKDRTRRYETANGLAADLNRHLKNEPVVARPQSTAYRVQKFVRRNKAAVVAATLVIFLLVAGVIGTSFGFFQAKGERAKALAAASDARIAQGEALTARGLAEDNAKELEANLYFNRVALAHRELTSEPPNILRAEELLGDCPAHLRDWEWHYLKRLRFTEPVVLHDPGSREVHSVALSHDGGYLAAACGDGYVRIWDVATRELLTKLPGHTGYVFCVTFHPTNSTQVASAALGDRGIKLWNWKEAKELQSWSCDFSIEYGMAYGVAFSPDGERLAANAEKGVAKVWRTSDGKEVLSLPGHEAAAMSVAFSPDGRRLVTGSHHDMVRIWDAQTGELLKTLGHTGTPVSCVTFSRDGRQLAAISFNQFAYVWDAESYHPLPRLRAHTEIATGLAFSEDGRRLASAGWDRTVTVWNSAKGQQQVLRFREFRGGVQCVVFSRDGRLLVAAGTDGTIRIWDGRPLTGDEDKSILTLTNNVEIWGMDVSTNGVWLASGGQSLADPTPETPVMVQNIRSNSPLHTLFGHGHKSIVFDLSFSPDQRFLASAGDDPREIGTGLFKVWDLATCKEAYPVQSFGGKGVLFSVTFSRDGRRIIAAGYDGVLRVWDAASGQLIGELGKHDREVYELAISSDGRYLASNGSDGKVKIWDGTRLDEPQTPLREFTVGRGDIANSIAFSPDSTRIAATDGDDEAKIVDVVTTNVVRRLASRAHGFLSLGFSPDGRWIASGGMDCTVKVWEAATGKLLHTFRGHQANVTRLAFVQRPEGLCVVSGSRDQTIKFWNVTALGQ